MSGWNFYTKRQLKATDEKEKYFLGICSQLLMFREIFHEAYFQVIKLAKPTPAFQISHIQKNISYNP
jgi:hypothetical protein